MDAAYRRYGSEYRPGLSSALRSRYNNDDNDDYVYNAQPIYRAPPTSPNLHRRMVKLQEEIDKGVEEAKKKPEYLLRMIFLETGPQDKQKIAELVDLLNKENYSSKPLAPYENELFLLFLVDNGLNPFPNLNIIRARAFVKNCQNYTNNKVMSILDNGLDVNSKFSHVELQIAGPKDEKIETMLDFYMRQLEYIERDYFKAMIEKFISLDAKVTPEDFLFNLAFIPKTIPTFNVITLLWDKYFNPEMINRQRLPYMYTPLMYAAKLNNLEMVNLLIKNGAKTAIKNKFGQTALHVLAYHVAYHFTTPYRVADLGYIEMDPGATRFSINPDVFDNDNDNIWEFSKIIQRLGTANPILTTIKDNKGATPIQYFDIYISPGRPKEYYAYYFRKAISLVTPWMTPKNKNLPLTSNKPGTLSLRSPGTVGQTPGTVGQTPGTATATCAPGNVGCFSFLGKGGRKASRRKIHRKKTRKAKRRY